MQIVEGRRKAHFCGFRMAYRAKATDGGEKAGPARGQRPEPKFYNGWIDLKTARLADLDIDPIRALGASRRRRRRRFELIPKDNLWRALGIRLRDRDGKGSSAALSRKLALPDGMLAEESR